MASPRERPGAVSPFRWPVCGPVPRTPLQSCAAQNDSGGEPTSAQPDWPALEATPRSSDTTPQPTKIRIMANQDLPPIGGYESIQWKRNLPSRGFRPTIWFAGLVGMTAYGFYHVCQGNREKAELKREKLWSRIYLMPLLQAETDRDVVRRTFAYYKREGEIMKDIPWWEVKSPYHSDDVFRPPQTAILGKQLDRDGFYTDAKSRNRFGPDEEK